MLNEEELEKSIFDILSNNPNFEGKVYLLDLPSSDFEWVRVIYDSMSLDSKKVYIDKKGCYINGRGQGQGDKSKMYLKDFENYIETDDWRDFVSKEVTRLNKKPRAIPINKLKIGCVYLEDDDNRSEKGIKYTFLGKTKTDESYLSGEPIYVFKETRLDGYEHYDDYRAKYAPKFIHENQKEDGFSLDICRKEYEQVNRFSAEWL